MPVESHAAQSPASRARTRRSLIQLGSLLAMTLVVVGVFAMFSVWSLNRAHVANGRQASEFLFALDEGRSAQTLFKIQVQEWKDVLLRGAIEADFTGHVDAFKANEARVQEQLIGLVARADQLGLPDMARNARALGDEHKQLGQAYRAALERGRATVWDPFAIDRSVQGIDRKLNKELDDLAAALLTENERRRLDVARREADRYETLRSFMGWSIAISIGLVGLVLRTALRRRTDLG